MKHFLNIYDFIDKDIKKIYDDNDDVIEIYLCAEFENYFFTKSQFINILLKNSIDKNIIYKVIKSKFYVVTGTSRFNEFNYSYTEFIYWDTFMFTETYLNLIHSNYKDAIPYKYHYICLNGRNRNHRAKFIDHLYKENLFDFGCISWLNLPHTTEVKPYEFKYWEPKILNLDLDNSVFNKPITEINQVLRSGLVFNPPSQYNNSFIQIIVESTIDRHTITEKTAIPFFLKKPFLAFSSKGYHALLSKYGFQLYDEIFDYSFDDKENDDQRIEGVLKNLKKIVSLNLNCCKKIRNKIDEKLEYNKTLAIKLATDKNFVPEIYLKNKNNILWYEKTLNTFKDFNYE